MSDILMPTAEVLPTPKRYPRGIDQAVAWPGGFSLSYWDLWFLLTLSEKYESSFERLETEMKAKLSRESHLEYMKHQRQLGWLTHLKDLESRIPHQWSIASLLRSIPEPLIRKEGKKALTKVLELDSGESLSEPMKNCPRVLLERRALRGQWKNLPIDPFPIAERALEAFINPKIDFYFKKQTFTLSRKVEKAFSREMKGAAKQPNPKAHEYAVLRAFCSVYTEAHNWDDSYGMMGDLLKRWMGRLGTFTPRAIGADSNVFYEDIFRYFIWEHWGCGDRKMLHPLFEAATPEEREAIAAHMLTARTDAERAFQWYTKEEAERFYKHFFPDRNFSRPTLKLPHLQLVTSSSSSTTSESV